MKILKRKYDLLKEELNSVQNKNNALDKDHIALVKEVSIKPLDDHEMALQEFVINDFNKTKLSFIIYRVSRSKGEGLGYSQKNLILDLRPRVNQQTLPLQALIRKGLTLILYLLMKM